ncbi:MAG: hypothetical protein ABI629_20155, partial [bacterium]
ERQTTIGGQTFGLQELTAAEVAAEVRITPRAGDIFFQAPPIQATKRINLHSAGKEMGLSLGTVDRVRMGYLFGTRERASGALKHALLFQSNFVEGSDRYVSAALTDGTPLQFTVTRAPDPCIPNCYPVIEALIIAVPDATLRAQQTSGLPLLITLDSGQVIHTIGLPAYVQGYLAAVDRYR